MEIDLLHYKTLYHECGEIVTWVDLKDSIRNEWNCPTHGIVHEVETRRKLPHF